MINTLFWTNSHSSSFDVKGCQGTFVSKLTTRLTNPLHQVQYLHFAHTRAINIVNPSLSEQLKIGGRRESQQKSEESGFAL